MEFDRRNELLTWSFINAKLVHNSFDEVKVDKKDNRRYRRIDPVDACIDAHYLELKYKTNDPNDVMNDYLSAMGWNE